MFKKHPAGGTRLYCFSPPVMIATFIIEIGLLIISARKYKPSKIQGLAIALLFFLAMFQLSEYFICGGWSLQAESWSRIGYIAITLLPVIGIHLIERLSGHINPWWRRLAYLSALSWVALFLFGDVFGGSVCGGNYVIFQLTKHYGGAYFMYYYFWLAVGIAMSLSESRRKKVKAGTKRALSWLAVGYLVFLVPTTTINAFYPQTMEGIPSIMCGFAIVFALILVFGVLPAVQPRTKRKTPKKSTKNRKTS